MASEPDRAASGGAAARSGSFRGPFRSLRRATRTVAGLASPLCRRWRWAASAVVAGVIPFLASWTSGVAGHQAVSAIALALLCLTLVAEDAWAKGVALILLAYAAHSAAVIVCARADPHGVAAVLPGAHDYWLRQLAWMRTGWDPEYQVGAWLPAHIQLAAASVLYTFTSFGALTFYQGFHEVDLMNYLNAQMLLNGSASALPLAWHPWSVLRGLGYALLTFEVASLAVRAIAGLALSTWRRRLARWTLGLGFLAADGLAKFLLLEPVRRHLVNSLR